ncbi:MAG: hypothetical protein PF572_01325 [Patescibacteria group bacterium]|jgi:hypothetical protein|nr:hypothetical protein [Patescibacteria group bacterium]
MNKIHLGTISILIKDRQSHAKDVNELLTINGHIIMARLGVNVQKSCVEHCTGFITIAVEATAGEISKLTKEIDELYGIVAKSSILTE